jgi:hypothetical protein
MYNNATNISQARDRKTVVLSMHKYRKKFTATKFLIKQSEEYVGLSLPEKGTECYIKY